MSPTVGSIGGITIVIWPFDHAPPHVHAYQGTPNTPTARMSRFVIATGNVIDKPGLSQALPASKTKQVQSWIADHRNELQTQWQQLQS
jgi:hypothetical protein